MVWWPSGLYQIWQRKNRQVNTERHAHDLTHTCTHPDMHTPRMHTPRMHTPRMHTPRMHTPHMHTHHTCTHTHAHTSMHTLLHAYIYKYLLHIYVCISSWNGGRSKSTV